MEDRASQRKQWKKEHSAGGVVFKNEDGKVFILLIQGMDKETKQASGKWSFPKGWIGDHGNETVEQAAIREVKEEGGVDAKIILKIDDTKYFFKWEGESIFKTVSWYLMEYVSGNPEEHDDEVSESRWVEIKEVESLLEYKSDKLLFNKAKLLLSSRT